MVVVGVVLGVAVEVVVVASVNVVETVVVVSLPQADSKILHNVITSSRQVPVIL